MLPETRYAKGPNGLIAYQVMGSGPTDLVYLSGSTSHVDVRWESPVAVRFFERLSSFSRVIAFDRRGIGASDPVALESLPSWEEWADDLRVVMDAAGSDRAALFAVLDAGPMAMLFAASHPQRVRALVLGNTSARVVDDEGYDVGMSREAADATVEVLSQLWGTEDLAVLGNPKLTTDPRTRAWFAKYMRASATPRVYEAQARSFSSLDVRSILPSIAVPTLVLHRTEFRFLSLAHAMYLAQNIPNARLVEVPGADASMFQEQTAVLDVVEEFLTGARRAPEPERVLATVVFTDIVGSTQMASEVGDRRWREVLDHHDEVVAAEVEGARGRLLKTTGDGALATFDAPGRAIRCTFAIREALAGAGLTVRAGVHTGEVELRGDDVGGIAVHIAERVSSAAGPGEVLVSRTVSDLVVGAELVFEDRGVHELRGVPGSWQLLAVAERPQERAEVTPRRSR